MISKEIMEIFSLEIWRFHCHVKYVFFPMLKGERK